MAQFTEVPPLTQINIFVKEVTGRICEVDASWSAWLTGDATIIDTCLTQLRSYYRPCHLKLLIEYMSLKSNPCNLIRQLIRPYGLTIQYRNSLWKIIRKHKDGIIDIGDPNIVSWS